MTLCRSYLNHDVTFDLSCSSLAASASAVTYHHESQRLFVGLGTGVIYVSMYMYGRDLEELVKYK